MFRALIIEDNPGARAELRELLSHHANITVIGEAPTVGRARTLLALDDYDLVFLDIELRGGNGFDLITHVRPQARIIFVTAYNDYAIRAFEVNALDYLLKPVDPQRLAESIQRVDSPPQSSAAFRENDVVHLPTDSGAIFVSPAEIIAIRSEQNYTQVYLEEGSRHLIRRPLKTWEEQLCPQLLRRVARDALVNLQHVHATTSLTDKTGQLELTGIREPIAVSSSHWSSIRLLVKRS